MAVGFDNTTDPRKLAANNRALLQQRGDQLFQDEGGRAQAGGDQASRYQGYLDELYGPMAQGHGGYTPEEQAAILRDGELQSYMATPDQLASNYLTSGEQGGIMGDTGSYTRNFDPNAMSQEQDISAGRQRQAVNDLQSNLRGSINPDALRQSDAYRQDSENQLNANQGQFGTVLGAVGNNVRGAIDPSAVQASDAFLKDYNMSPEEQQNLVTSAGISAGAKDSAAVGDLERRAAAAGASPMGVGAYRARLARQQAADAGDAMTKARVDASNAAAARKLSGEQLREQGGQYLTGVRTGTELQMGEDALRGTQALGDQALAQRNTVEGNRQGAEQYLTGANLQAATTGGQAQVGNEANINSQGRQQQQFNTTTGTGIAEAQDAANSARSAQVAGNRQNVNLNNQNTTYNQGTGVSNTMSARNQNVANTRLGTQQQGLNYYQGQQQQGNANQQGSYGRQAGLYGTQAGASNGSTALGLNASQTPTTFDKVMGGISGGLGAVASFLDEGGVVTQPTIGVVGENGPEKIVPLRARLRDAATAGAAGTAALASGGQTKPWWQSMGNIGSSAGSIYRAANNYRKSRMDPQKTSPDAYGPGTGGGMYNFPQPDPTDAPVDEYMSDGKVVTKPTLAVLGEDGPEAVVPMGYRAKAKTRPSLASGGRSAYGQVA